MLRLSKLGLEYVKLVLMGRLQFSILRDWSKSMGGGGGPEQRGGGSSVFEPLVRGGSCNF